MGEHDEVYGADRIKRLRGLLLELAERIQELDRRGVLLQFGPELLERMGTIRSELFHYEVRSTYDTPEVSESRRIVEEAQEGPDFSPNDSEDDQPWRQNPPE